MDFCLSPGFLSWGEGNTGIGWERLSLLHFQTGCKQEILASFQDSLIPGAARSKGARNTARFQPRLSRILQRSGEAPKVL